MPRTILITGVSSGIGLAVASRLLARGDRVLGIARRASTLEAHPGLTACDLDLRGAGLLERLAPVLRGRELDGAVLCAGAGLFKGLEQCSEAEIREQVDVNLTSQVIVARAVVPILKASGGGDLVLLGSESALHGRRRGAVYCATKFGLRGLAQSLREEGARSSLRVSLVNPGSVRTPFFDALEFEPGEADDNALSPQDVAEVLLGILDAPRRVVFDEVNLGPQRRVLRFRSGKTTGPDAPRAGYPRPSGRPEAAARRGADGGRQARGRFFSGPCFPLLTRFRLVATTRLFPRVYRDVLTCAGHVFVRGAGAFGRERTRRGGSEGAPARRSRLAATAGVTAHSRDRHACRRS